MVKMRVIKGHVVGQSLSIVNGEDESSQDESCQVINCQGWSLEVVIVKGNFECKYLWELERRSCCRIVVGWWKWPSSHSKLDCRSKFAIKIGRGLLKSGTWINANNNVNYTPRTMKKTISSIRSHFQRALKEKNLARCWFNAKNDDRGYLYDEKDALASWDVIRILKRRLESEKKSKSWR